MWKDRGGPSKSERGITRTVAAIPTQGAGERESEGRRWRGRQGIREWAWGKGAGGGERGLERASNGTSLSSKVRMSTQRAATSVAWTPPTHDTEAMACD
eukprot:327307-Rhodomonas_salina.1